MMGIHLKANFCQFRPSLENHWEQAYDRTLVGLIQKRKLDARFGVDGVVNKDYISLTIRTKEIPNRYTFIVALSAVFKRCKTRLSSQRYDAPSGSSRQYRISSEKAVLHQSTGPTLLLLRALFSRA